jgi:DNA polymerase III subunit delta'
MDVLVGQDRAVERLRRAAERPAHAYLLAGPRGTEVAARGFAAAILDPVDASGGEVSRRALGGLHPDVVEFEPDGNQILVAQADAIMREAYRSPIEGERKIVIVLEADRLNEASSNKLLKTLEEPPASTTMVLVTSSPDDLLDTVRSRCQRVDLVALSETTLRAALVESGVEARRADVAARLAGGRLDRAELLAGPMGVVRDAFVVAAADLDGSGASVVRAAEGINAAMQDALTALEAEQQREVDELAAEIERAGYPDSAANALVKRLAERHKRQHRRARTAALLEGITALETLYRDALAGPDASPRNIDRPRLNVSARSCAHALDACSAARAAFEFNPSESLLLEHLLLQLPGSSAGTRE